MLFSDRMAAVKPYAIGTGLGAVAALMIGFSADLMVTTGTAQAQADRARIDAFAQVCEQQAARHWTAEGKDLADLDGWRNDQRENLAKRFTAGLSTEARLDGDIQDQCESLLKPT
jgi:hypothetical protein